jgi:hypothetical protein
MRDNGIGAEGTGRQDVWQERGVKRWKRDRQVVFVADMGTRDKKCGSKGE